MNTESSRNNLDGIFNKMVLVSCVLHAALFLFLALRTLIFPSQPIDLEQSIRVDLVALPDKLPGDLPEAPVEQKNTEPARPRPEVRKAIPKRKALPQKKQPVPKPVEMPDPRAARVKKRQADVNEAMDKIRELEEQEQRAQAEEAQRHRKERLERARNAIIKGNQINAGSSLRGIEKVQFDDYLAQIHAHVLKFWDLPAFIQNDSLKAVVIVHLDENGNVIKRMLEKSSGDQRFDALVLRTVDNSSPFPRPPEKFIEKIKDNGIGLQFPE